MPHNKPSLKYIIPKSYGFAETLKVSLDIHDCLGDQGRKTQLSIELPSSIDACDRTTLLLSIANELPSSEFVVERNTRSDDMLVTATYCSD
jgi:hypothetical protein